MDFCHDLARDWGRLGGQFEQNRRPTAPVAQKDYEKVVDWSDLDGVVCALCYKALAPGYPWCRLGHSWVLLWRFFDDNRIDFSWISGLI